MADDGVSQSGIAPEDSRPGLITLVPRPPGDCGTKSLGALRSMDFDVLKKLDKLFACPSVAFTGTLLLRLRSVNRVGFDVRFGLGGDLVARGMVMSV